MDDMGFAGQLTVVALGALIFISFFFIGLTRFLSWLARRTSKEKAETAEVAIPAKAEKRKRARIAMAAVMSYLEAERVGRIRGSKGSMDAKPESTRQEGGNEEEIQDHHRG